MSIPRGMGQNGGHYYSNITQPVKLDLNFVVDSTNGNGLGIRSLKSNGYVQSVFMNTTNSSLANQLNLGSARTYSVLAASAVTNTGSSVLSGGLGEYPGSTVSGFPPGTATFTNIGNAAAQSAQAQALAAYTAGVAKTSTPITANLDGQTLTPGVYSESAGTFNLAQAGNGTLTLNGNGVYIFKASSTLVTGAGGTPTITLAGGAQASNVYWLVGSSATINSGNTGVFQGNIIAVTSITDTLGGTVNGSMIALNGAVTMSAATIANAKPLTPSVIGGPSNPAPGYAWIQFKNNFNKYLGGFSGFVSPLSGSTLTSVVAGQAYVIVSLGTATLAQWLAVGVPPGLTPAVGMSFIASASQSIGGSAAVQAPAVSGISSVEVVGDPNLSIANSQISQNNGAWLLVQFLSNGVLTAPVDNSVCGMSAFFDLSSVSIDGL